MLMPLGCSSTQFKKYSFFEFRFSMLTWAASASVVWVICFPPVAQ